MFVSINTDKNGYIIKYINNYNQLVDLNSISEIKRKTSSILLTRDLKIINLDDNVEIDELEFNFSDYEKALIYMKKLEKSIDSSNIGDQVVLLKKTMKHVKNIIDNY